MTIEIGRQAEAQTALRNVDAAINKLHTLVLPSVIVTVGGTFEDPEMVFTCPWCKAEISREGGVYDLDVAFRHNDLTLWPIRENDPTQGTASVSQGDKHFDSVCYVATCCTTPVDLPDEWDTTWV